MRIQDILSEKRRNPELNRKIGALESLQKYAGQKDMFVSFTADVGKESHADFHISSNTSGAKIGINPNTIHSSTPNGIYAYPIDYVLSRKLHVPYAGQRPFIWVLRATEMSRMLDLQNVSQDDLMRADQFCQSAEAHTDPDTSYGYQIWNLFYSEVIATRREPRSVPFEWAALLMKFGYAGAIDNGHGIVHPMEPYQAVFFSKSAFAEVELLRNIQPKKPGDAALISPKSFWQLFNAGKLDEADILEVIEDNFMIIPTITGNDPTKIEAMLQRLPASAIDLMKRRSIHYPESYRQALRDY